MPSIGPVPCEFNTDDSAVGTVAWTDPGNAAASDNARATASLSETQTHYLSCLGPDFDPVVPADATINGIEVFIERSTDGGGGTISDTVVSLVKAGAVVGDNKASASAWPTTDATATYGGASDLWGTTWTAAQVEAVDFGVVLSASEALGIPTVARVDYVAMTVHYTPATGGMAQQAQSRRVRALRRI